MTAYVSAAGPSPEFEMFWNGPITQLQSGTPTMWTWFRSLNTQEWLGPFPLNDSAFLTVNDRYSRWFVQCDQIPDFAKQHRDGFYQVVTTPPFGPTDKPTFGPINLGMVRLIFSPGGEIDTKPYISNNEQRESDTYFRPNYT